MTSALHLLYIWRSTGRRSQEPAAELHTDPPDSEPDVRRGRRDLRHGGFRGSGIDISRRSYGRAPKAQHSGNCGSHKEHELGRSARISSDDYCPGNSSSRASNSRLSRMGPTRNDQLPGAVQEARKRLFERLRGASLTESRQSAVPVDILHSESAPADNINANYTNLDPEILRQWPNSNMLHGESNILTEQASSLHATNKKKFPALSWDAFCSKKGETFRSPEEIHEDGVMGKLTECCICLERFVDGDWLLKLCCSHMFHPSCLEPWVRSCGDCPLCRADIV